MKVYQCFIILKSTIKLEQGDILIDTLRKYIEENGEIIKTEFLGLRKLLNESGKTRQGYYYSIRFRAEEEISKELGVKCQNSDETLRYIIIDEN